MKSISIVVVLMFLALGTATAADKLDAEKARLERNKQTVTAFYTAFMNDHDPQPIGSGLLF